MDTSRQSKFPSIFTFCIDVGTVIFFVLISGWAGKSFISDILSLDGKFPLQHIVSTVMVCSFWESEKNEISLNKFELPSLLSLKE